MVRFNKNIDNLFSFIKRGLSMNSGVSHLLPVDSAQSSPNPCPIVPCEIPKVTLAQRIQCILLWVVVVFTSLIIIGIPLWFFSKRVQQILFPKTAPQTSSIVNLDKILEISGKARDLFRDSPCGEEQLVKRCEFFDEFFHDNSIEPFEKAIIANVVLDTRCSRAWCHGDHSVVLSVENL
jgi:hypothetical protein